MQVCLQCQYILFSVWVLFHFSVIISHRHLELNSPRDSAVRENVIFSFPTAFLTYWVNMLSYFFSYFMIVQ